MSSVSPSGTQIFHHGHNGTVDGAAVHTGGGYGASELAGGDNGLLVGGATGGIAGEGSGLVGPTAGDMNLLFLVLSSSRAGLNLIGSRGFLCGSPNDFCFLPD